MIACSIIGEGSGTHEASHYFLMTTQMAQQCLDDLGALEARMDEEGFWLTGWRGGTTMGPAAPGAAGMPPAGAAGVGAGAAAAPSPDPGTAMGVGEAGPALP